MTRHAADELKELKTPPCADTDNGANSHGITCDFFSRVAVMNNWDPIEVAGHCDGHYSQFYDDSDFSLSDMCCLCGGGASPPPATTSATAAANSAATPLASAVGDPHMQNILGQHFDIAQPGEHTLLEIPRGASASHALLHVTADAKHEGGACSDMYFKALNITGLWVSAQQEDGYMYTAEAPQPVVGWRRFGKVEVKVAWGRTLGGVEYLNFMVRHLMRFGQDVGGLLGMDDYTQAAKRDPSCGSVTLVQLHSAPQEASFAMADM